jgi:hypothetical protein
MSPAHDGVKMEERRRFIEGEGWEVTEVPVGTALAPGQVKNPKAPKEPAVPVVLTVADISLDLARQVIEANGLLAVPASFLNETQLEELALSPAAVQPPVVTAPAAKELNEKDAIKRIKAAISFEELNELTANESRAAVLNAAETKAAELKG